VVGAKRRRFSSSVEIMDINIVEIYYGAKIIMTSQLAFVLNC
jgi:hypothetical protein